jgi:hypothetical protein
MRVFTRHACLSEYVTWSLDPIWDGQKAVTNYQLGSFWNWSLKIEHWLLSREAALNRFASVFAGANADHFVKSKHEHFSRAHHIIAR